MPRLPGSPMIDRGPDRAAAVFARRSARPSRVVCNKPRRVADRDGRRDAERSRGLARAPSRWMRSIAIVCAPTTPDTLSAAGADPIGRAARHVRRSQQRPAGASARRHAVGERDRAVDQHVPDAFRRQRRTLVGRMIDDRVRIEHGEVGRHAERRSGRDRIMPIVAAGSHDDFLIACSHDMIFCSRT